MRTRLTTLLKQAVDNANRELAPFQQIRYWLRWPQAEFPRTSTGKVLRRSVQSWAQQSLAAGGAAATNPADPLVELLQQLGAADREVTASDRLAEDLHLDSLAMVQLQSALETRFGLELDDAVWGQVKTVGDVRGLLQRPQPGVVREAVASVPIGTAAASPSDRAPATLPAVPSQKEAVVFPRWPWWPAVRLAAHRLSRSSHASAGVAAARAPHRAARSRLPGPRC